MSTTERVTPDTKSVESVEQVSSTIEDPTDAATKNIHPNGSSGIAEGTVPSKSPDVSGSADKAKGADIANAAVPSKGPDVSGSADKAKGADIANAAVPSKGPDVSGSADIVDGARPSKGADKAESMSSSKGADKDKSAGPSKGADTTDTLDKVDAAQGIEANQWQAIPVGDGKPKPTIASMREGAMARVAPRRTVSARKKSPSGMPGAAGGSVTASPAAPATPDPGPTGAVGGVPRASKMPRRVGPRRVRLTIQRMDPWSVFKISFLLSVAFGIATVVMVAVLWIVLSNMGVFNTVNDFIVSITSGEETASTFDLMDYIGLGRVVSLSAVFAVANVLLLTALATLGAFLYNICSALVGGAHFTMSDD